MNEQGNILVCNYYTFEDFNALINALSDGLSISAEAMQEAYQSLSFYDLKKTPLQEEIIKILPRKIALKAEAIIIDTSGPDMIIGMINPLNTKSIALLESGLGSSFIPVLVAEKDLRQILGKYYSHIPDALKIVQQFKPEKSQDDRVFVGATGVKNDVATLFELLMQEALQVQASDIHIETFEEQLSIRFRVDGVLRQYKVDHTYISQYFLRYIKILANSDIAEERQPIDGQHMSVNVGNRKFNIRLSIIPSAFGYSIVMRLLGEASHLSLKKIIKDPSYVTEILNYLNLKQGVFIVSGPTGSGKTTTLLSALSEINTSDRKIITIEDPVEYKVSGITQIQINTKINYGFGEALRSILRQDPDVIMVGEIRDDITANAAIRAAVTGHMVLATVHTRSASDIPGRLMDLGVDPFSLSMALRLLVSQRLMRTLCDNCKVPHALSTDELSFLKIVFPTFTEQQCTGFYKALDTGCDFCHHTGYSGQTIIYELLKTTQEMVFALGEKDFKKYYELVEKTLKGKKLLDRALDVALKGQTSINEVLSFND